ncbi:hypothetical protein KRR40_47200 [Niabella defluvii]|nr:hypothetical protein KRR40_47200 [Niabella sp. I65]
MDLPIIISATGIPTCFGLKWRLTGRKEISFVLIHAKADNDPASYNRRLGGSLELKDSLDTYYAGKNVIILGDYNDNFDKSIVTGKPSPYQNFLNDAVRYNPITRPLNVPGISLHWGMPILLSTSKL